MFRASVLANILHWWPIDLGAAVSRRCTSQRSWQRCHFPGQFKANRGQPWNMQCKQCKPFLTWLVGTILNHLAASWSVVRCKPDHVLSCHMPKASRTAWLEAMRGSLHRTWHIGHIALTCVNQVNMVILCKIQYKQLQASTNFSVAINVPLGWNSLAMHGVIWALDGAGRLLLLSHLWVGRRRCSLRCTAWWAYCRSTSINPMNMAEENGVRPVSILQSWSLWSRSFD